MVTEGGQRELSTAVEHLQVTAEEKERQGNSPSERGGECPEGETIPAVQSGEDEPRRKPLHSEVVDMDTAEEQLPYFFPAHPISYFSNDNDNDKENSLEENCNEDIPGPPLSPSPHHSPTLLPTLSSTAVSLIHDVLQQPSLMPRPPPATIPSPPKVYDVRLSDCVSLDDEYS